MPDRHESTWIDLVWSRAGRIVVALVALITAILLWRSLSGPKATLPEDQLIIRPAFTEQEDIPADLEDKFPPAALIDPADARLGELWPLIIADWEKMTASERESAIAELIEKGTTLSLDAEKKDEFTVKFKNVVTATNPYVWVQPYGSPDLLPGFWSELPLTSEERSLFFDWFTLDKSVILLEPTG